MIKKEKQNIQNKEPKMLISFSTILGILGILLSGLVIIFQFSEYVYRMQWFYRWKINEVFFVQDSMNIVNNLMYSCFILGVIVFLFILMYRILNTKKRQIKNWIKFLIFFVPIYSLLSIKTFYNYNFNMISYFFGMFICLVFFKFYIKKVSKFINVLKNAEQSFILHIELIEDLFIIFIITFIIVIGLGFFNALFIRDYQIISNDKNDCSVILYSTKDYYIIANCTIEDNNLIVYNNTQRKINNYNIMSHWENFDKIIKK